MHYRYLALSLLLFLSSCGIISPGSSKSDKFSTSPEKFPVQPGLVDEASGIVASSTMDGRLWVEEDSGNPAEINLMTTDGKLEKRFPLAGISNRDWEDLAIGPGPQSGVSYLYMADIGDNLKQNDVSYIYRFPEPKNTNENITGIERISFRYSDGPRDAEAILLDPQTRDLWIVSKAEEKVHMYRLSYPQSTTDVIKADYYGELPLNLITGGSVSADGNEIALISYLGAYHWRRKSGQSLADALQKNSYTSLATDPIGTQSEAICFDKNSNGYYTLPEKGNQASVTLNYYKRL
ncbi:PE-PGRS family protein [Larkinella terrae]|uniref:PE-PGRS family protein n=1 Tax=Larkinella terrae TaxID=2025311 RepID=A0A7K0EDV3_9BACT|nr:PE-PGRS family protein [Larkinella terrae]MRS60004.1 PE-PGRS family protein [Larkinella terrae]